MERMNWERIAAILFCIAFGIVLFFYSFRYLLPLLFPFLVAWIFSLLIRPIAARIASHFKISKKLCALLLLAFFLGGAIFLIGAAVNRLFNELQRLLESLLGEGGKLSDLLQSSADYFDALTSKIGFLKQIGADERFSNFRETVNGMVEEMLGSLLNSLSAKLPIWAAKLVTGLPTFMFVTIVSVISCFYFCVDEVGILNRLCQALPCSFRQRFSTWKRWIKSFSWRYVRAYLLLLLLTFAELFLGFTVLRIDYAFLLALTVAVVDMLPILGVGTVLVPWSLVLLLRHEFYLGFGLLILYGTVLILRQILEPRLIGKSLGLHPLLTLFSGYVGWSLLGVIGLLLGPILAMVLKMLFEKHSEA